MVVAVGRTAGGKASTCTLLSAAFGAPARFPSSHGYGRTPTRGLWGSELFDYGGRRYLLLDIEGWSAMEQSAPVAEGLLKLLAVLSEVTSLFVQARDLLQQRASRGSEGVSRKAHWVVLKDYGTLNLGKYRY